MLRAGHLGLNSLLYAPIAITVALLGSFELAIWGAMIMIVGAHLPDLDTRTSLVKHRGITHTVWFAALIGGICAGISIYMTLPHSLITVMLFSFTMGAYGVIGHILGDIMTPMGIRPYRPVRDRKYALGMFKASNTLANSVFMFIGLAALGGALVYGFVEAGIQSEFYLENIEDIIENNLF